jgi:hypothetical protein
MHENDPTPEELKQLQREEAIVTSLGRQQRKEQKEDYYGPDNDMMI